MEKAVKQMEQTVNNVNVVGILVKNSLDIKVNNDGKEYVGGNLILRTVDGSEHQIDYYANKFTKEGKESSLYKGLVTIYEEAKSLENVETPSEADVIRIGGAEFSVNDFKAPKDGTLQTSLKIRAKFANRLSEKEKEITPRVATFEISGVLTKMEDEIFKGNPTGDGVVVVDVIGYNSTVIPVKCKISKDKKDGFVGAGFYVGGTAKLSGEVINTTVNDTITESQAFGEDLVKTVSFTKKYIDIRGGSPLGSLDSIKITEDEYKTALSKRRLHLDEVITGKPSNTNDTPFGSSGTVEQPKANPFNTKPNPFQK